MTSIWDEPFVIEAPPIQISIQISFDFHHDACYVWIAADSAKHSGKQFYNRKYPIKSGWRMIEKLSKNGYQVSNMWSLDTNPYITLRREIDKYREIQ